MPERKANRPVAEDPHPKRVRLRKKEVSRPPSREIPRQTSQLAKGRPAVRRTARAGPKQSPATGEIPWGYGRDRITAMAVDPERMFVYWEIRDDTIDLARKGLGSYGADALLVLRVYDTSGRIFDGTNAHRHFDIEIERSHRQWFVPVGNPGSTWCVEVGLRSSTGGFQRIARSGRVDFPRRSPPPTGQTEWMTVFDLRSDGERTISQVDLGSPRPDVSDPVANTEEPFQAGEVETGHNAPNGAGSVVILEAAEAIRVAAWKWARSWRAEWPPWHSTWEAGPFSFPVPQAGSVEEHIVRDPVIELVPGGARIIRGQWEVVIRGLAAGAGGRVLALWRVQRAWIAEGLERVSILRTSTPGEPQGASERLRLAGSETRLAGASELYWLGASELRFRGASETLFAGASERRLRGASELRWLGASEGRLGAGDQRHGPRA